MRAALFATGLGTRGSSSSLVPLSATRGRFGGGLLSCEFSSAITKRLSSSSSLKGQSNKMFLFQFQLLDIY